MSGAPVWYARRGAASGAYDAWSILLRMVLVNWNGGDVTAATSPADYNQAMPEEGTVFRIITAKPNFPGDVLYVDSPVSVWAEGELPATYFLFQNYPNPFNPGTQIQFDLAHKSWVKLEIFNILGQKVRTLIDLELGSGVHSISWNGHDNAGIKLGSGIYFYRLSAGGYLKTRKTTLLR